LDTLPLDGLKILILEDEFLIAMEVEQACRDSGAAAVRICRSVEEVGVATVEAIEFDAAVIDMRLGEDSSLDFARMLFDGGHPFVFATGYSDPSEMSEYFPGVPVVTKPYLGSDLVAALAEAVHRKRRTAA
jgi:CheY-like chemotaxis protein